jgi:voltage-gated potassium channel
VVTITTVGYGDIVPTSKVGKIFALIIVISGPALLALITASIASIFVERKITSLFAAGMRMEKG